MNHRPDFRAEDEFSLLVVSPRSADAEVLKAVLAGIDWRVEAVDPGALGNRDIDGIGCLILSQEALTDDLRAQVAGHLNEQASWSELPVIVLYAADQDGQRLEEMLSEGWQRAKIILLRRPVRPLEFLTRVQLAMSGRLRQFSIRDQLVREQELRRELNHRVKNILATVRAIGNMTLRKKIDPAVFSDYSDRLAALASVHEALHLSADEAIGFADLCMRLALPYVEDDAARFAAATDCPPLQPDAARTLGLCIHELLTNAIKYGALSVPQGRAEASMTLEDQGQVTFLWRESNGPPVAAPARRGYGTRFLTSSLKSVFGTEPALTYDRGGFALQVSGHADRLLKQPGPSIGG